MGNPFSFSRINGIGIDENYERNNKAAVLEAIENDWHALESASTELKNDRDIVLKAIENKGRALEGASRKLQNHKDVFLMFKG